MYILSMEYLRNELEKIIKIEDIEWKDIIAKFKTINKSKGDLIHRSGEIFNECWYLESGLARSFFNDANGKDFTWQLYFRDETSSGINLFLDDSVGYYENEGSILSFEVLEDSRFQVIKIDELDNIFNMSKKWEHLGRIFKHNAFYSSTYKRALSVMSESAEFRYKRLVKEHPNIFNIVKSYHIASYLGIAPQTLSKLRKYESR